MGFDVSDECVQYVNLTDRWDGFIVTLNDRVARGATAISPVAASPSTSAPAAPAWPRTTCCRCATRSAAPSSHSSSSPTPPSTPCASTPTRATPPSSMVVLTKIGYPPGVATGSCGRGFDLLDGDSVHPLDAELRHAHVVGRGSTRTSAARPGPTWTRPRPSASATSRGSPRGSRCSATHPIRSEFSTMIRYCARPAEPRSPRRVRPPGPAGDQPGSGLCDRHGNRSTPSTTRGSRAGSISIGCRRSTPRTAASERRVRGR